MAVPPGGPAGDRRGALFSLPSVPLLQWGRTYDRDSLAGDLLAAAIVTVMLIPQSLAYALLAGLPLQAGLYASVAPLVLYAIFGTSRVLAVGPVAVVSLMTATAIAQLPPSLGLDPAQAALGLALLSGAILLLMGLLRLGALAHFLSHPVISGFITASAVLITASQLKSLLGVTVTGQHLPEMLVSLITHAHQMHLPTAAIGLGSLVFLFWVRRGLKPLLLRTGLSPKAADIFVRAAPVAAIAATAGLAAGLDLAAGGLKVVGHVPQGLPPLTMPPLDLAVWSSLALPALLISVVGFVESVSVGQTLAARRRERIEPDQELVALGASNFGASLTGGFPVTGGFARSVVNADAGARTPAAGVFTAMGLLAASVWLTPLLKSLPQATLAATIIVAVVSLVDLGTLQRTWSYSRPDFAALVGTLVATLLLGVEVGLVAGVSLSLGLHLRRTSRPHIAEIGMLAGTEHFRNVHRHAVLTSPRLLGLRVDGSLYFANARELEDRLNDAVAAHPGLEHVVLQCSAINDIDASALESLESIDARLRDAGLTLHLSEVKGPVMDRLGPTHFLQHLRGKVFMTHYQAVRELTPELFEPAAPGVQSSALR